MEEEYEAIDKIINKVLERNNATTLKYMNGLFREIAKEALNEGFEAGYQIGYDSGYDTIYGAKTD